MKLFPPGNGGFLLCLKAFIYHMRENLSSKYGGNMITIG
jgi:hypothetical protein